MPENFADRLIQAVKAKKTPTCVGIDPIYARLPAEITENRELNDESDSEVALDAVLEYCRRVIKIVAPLVPAVKINSAFFERYYWEGIEGYWDLIQEADQNGLIVIGDCKRSDIGSTAEMYARSALAEPDFNDMDSLTGPDAVTVVPYAGLDGVKPFIDIAREEQKGVFVWVRASNESSAIIQEVKLESGLTFAEHMAQQVDAWSRDSGLIGSTGYSTVGAVVAARDKDSTARLRELMPHCYFLVPGYGAQGGTADDIVPCFKPDGTGAIVTASRSVIYAYEDMKYIERFPSEWDKCIEQACKDFIADISKVVRIS
ncbi:MAG: orotidine-5'-phosphate decarboxylase [Phycisphaerales bacterium]|nr:orotidine-5'-phosphate decarboxylase [Phycisphaerales bacterium]